MRFLALLLIVAAMATAGSPVSQAFPDVVKTREGSLVIEPSSKEPGGPPKKDLLHSMLSREVQIYIFRSTHRAFPQPYPLASGHYFQPASRFPKVAGPYLESLIQKYARLHGVDPALVRAVMRHESGFDPNAVSPKGAQGLMQLMPGTAALMGVSNPFDPEQNIAGGVGYLRYCLDRFGHNVPLAVAAYNAGPERVAKIQGVPAIAETQNFVKNVLGSYNGGAPLAAPTPPASQAPKAKMTPSPSPSGKILPARSKLTPAAAETEKAAPRPRPKVIVVHYPRPKQVAAANPQDAD